MATYKPFPYENVYEMRDKLQKDFKFAQVNAIYEQAEILENIYSMYIEDIGPQSEEALRARCDLYEKMEELYLELSEYVEYLKEDELKGLTVEGLFEKFGWFLS